MRWKRILGGVAMWTLTLLIVPLTSAWIMSFRDLTFSFVHLKEHRVFVGLAKGAIDIEVLQGPGVGIEEVLRMLARSRDVLEKENYAPKRVTHDDENDAISKLEVVRDGGATWLPQGYF